MKRILLHLAVLALFSASGIAAGERPNLVFILLDNIGQEWFGCYGSEEKCTPIILFHLAPLACLKFRGRKQEGPEARQVTEVALANYVVNSDPDGIDHGLEQKPMLAFAVCYVAAHLALDLLDKKKAEAILTYCENHLAES